MRWTYNKTQEYVQRMRRFTLRRGCRKCEKMALTLELVGSPTLTRLARDGYGLERIKNDVRTRGLFCRSCAKGINRKQVATLLEGWKKEKKQLQLPDKRNWDDDAKWEFCLDEVLDLAFQESRAREVWSGAELEEALNIIRADS